MSKRENTYDEGNFLKAIERDSFWQKGSKQIVKVILDGARILEGESLWRNPSSNTVAQYEDLSGELQVTIQEVIDMIDGSTECSHDEETRGDNVVQEETRGDNVV